jgi:TRAP-type C4-dicarboxylate transport system substrate-binding protein
MKKGIALYNEKGVKVHIATPEELAKFKKAMAPVHEWWLSKVPEGKKYIEFAEKNH